MKYLIIMLILSSLIICGYLIFLYNKIIRSRNEIDNSLHQIDVQLNRRYDLIPNLVTIAKKYMEYEKGILEKIAELRSNTPANIWETTPQAAEVRSAVSSLYARFEQYPELKADQNMKNLMEELNSTENRIAFARQHYNDCINFYNDTIGEFPANFIAKHFNFASKQYLDLPKYPNIEINF